MKKPTDLKLLKVITENIAFGITELCRFGALKYAQVTLIIKTM